MEFALMRVNSHKLFGPHGSKSWCGFSIQKKEKFPEDYDWTNLRKHRDFASLFEG